MRKDRTVEELWFVRKEFYSEAMLGHGTSSDFFILLSFLNVLSSHSPYSY